MVPAVSIIRTYHSILAYNLLPGCTRAGPAADIGWVVWAIFLSLESTYMLLMAYKMLSFRKIMNSTITVLSRDSIVYFILIFLCMMVNLIADRDFDIQLHVTFPSPTQCITSIAVGRMMMNIRGLILDDPEHTFYLQTLQFDTETNAAPQIMRVA